MKKSNLIYFKKGQESLLFLLPIEVATELTIENHDLVEYAYINGALVIRKSESSENRLSRKEENCND